MRQPYVGGVGGGLLDNVSKIDIHSDNPLGETFKTISGVATDLKTFVQNNKDQLTEDLTSPLTAKINSAQGAIKIAFSEEAREHFPDIEKAISFSFGIKHAGDSIIRAKDGQYHYFTTRSHEMETDETAGKAEQNNHGLDCQL